MKDTMASLLMAFLALGLLILGKANCHVVSSPMERPVWLGTEASGQQSCD